MKFTNVVAYCKGFYVTRENVNEMWKDFYHCIQVDGWNVYNKRDVAQWCMNRIEDFAREFPKEAWKVSFCKFYSEMMNNKEIAEISARCHNEQYNLDDYDLIIWTYRDFIRYLDGDMFSDGYIPDERVLQLNKENISESIWNKITSKYKKQCFSEWYQTSFEEREKNLKNYSK